MKRRAKKGDWVVVGGKPGELGYCTRCGEGLSINLPQRLEVITAAMTAFAKAHSTCPEGEYHEKPATSLDEWVNGRDTGVSSATIYSAITGLPSPYQRFDVPHDPGDFGRCYRLIKLFPSWRKDLKKTVAICSEWQPFVTAWDELSALYEKQLASGSSLGYALYERIKQLEGRAA